MLDETGFVSLALAAYGIEPKVEVVGVEPGEAEIVRAAAAARQADATILFLYDAHLYRSNRALLDALQEATPSLGVVLMRDPWDAEYLAPGVVGVTTYGWRRCQLDAALTRLRRGEVVDRRAREVLHRDEADEDRGGEHRDQQDAARSHGLNCHGAGGER